MRRILFFLVVVALALVMAVPALASPIGPGPNSFEAILDFGGSNFGHCQSQVAKGPGSAESAQEANPAIFTGQNSGFGVFCTKAPK